MKKMLIVLLALLTLLASCAVSNRGEPEELEDRNEVIEPVAQPPEDTKKPEANGKEQTIDEHRLLTPEELIEMKDIPEGMYERDFLERFIEFFYITQENVNTLNIELLLSSYEELDKMKNVESIFAEKTTDTVPSDPKAITAIAFYENINTGIESVYYDFQTLERYYTAQGNVFWDLNQAEELRSMEQAEADDLREALVDLNVLSWVDTKSSEKIDDPQAMCIAIRFNDGSLFRVQVSGRLYMDGPNGYGRVRELLLRN